MPFGKIEKYPNNDIDYNEENDNTYYYPGSPDFGGSHYSDIDAAGQFKYENNNNNLYPNNIYITFAPQPVFYQNQSQSLFGNITNNNQIGGGLFGNSYNNSTGNIFGNFPNTNPNGLFGTNNNKGKSIFGNNNNNNNTENVFPLFTS